MDQPQFKGYISRQLVAAFLDSIWKDCKGRFSEKGFDTFEEVVSCLISDPGVDDDWEKSYVLTFGKPYSDYTLLTEDETFTLMIEQCAKYLYSFGYDVSELLHLLFLIRYQPQEAQKETSLWKEKVAEFLKIPE